MACLVLFSYRWSDPNDQVLVETGRIKSVDSKLYMTNVQPSDSGNYSCTASNMAGTKTASVWVVVSGKPKAIENLTISFNWLYLFQYARLGGFCIFF